MARGINRRRDGSYRVRLPAEERDILAALPGPLREALDAGEPTLYRWFPPDGKRAALSELERTAHAESLTEEELRTWLGGLESLRLVLGTQLDVSEESYGPLDRKDPDAPRLALYHWLSWLQEEVVQALSASLPETSDPDELD